jgi:hypothetical protein
MKKEKRATALGKRIITGGKRETLTGKRIIATGKSKILPYRHELSILTSFRNKIIIKTTQLTGVTTFRFFHNAALAFTLSQPALSEVEVK